jgi:hypothetical protein
MKTRSDQKLQVLLLQVPVYILSIIVAKPGQTGHMNARRKRLDDLLQRAHYCECWEENVHVDESPIRD